MALSPTSSHGSGSSSSFARVQRAGAIAGWDGSTLPFDVVTVDVDGLWDAANHQFVAKVAGWYEVAAYGSRAAGPGITDAAAATDTIYTVLAVVFGAGDNIATGAGGHTAVTTGVWIVPPLYGHTELGVGDAVVIQGTNGLDVPAGFTFAIRGPL